MQFGNVLGDGAGGVGDRLEITVGPLDQRFYALAVCGGQAAIVADERGDQFLQLLGPWARHRAGRGHQAGGVVDTAQQRDLTGGEEGLLAVAVGGDLMGDLVEIGDDLRGRVLDRVNAADAGLVARFFIGNLARADAHAQPVQVEGIGQLADVGGQRRNVDFLQAVMQRFQGVRELLDIRLDQGKVGRCAGIDVGAVLGQVGRRRLQLAELAKPGGLGLFAVDGVKEQGDGRRDGDGGNHQQDNLRGGTTRNRLQ